MIYLKKVLFLQLKGNSIGGVWFVNKALGEEFLKRGYEVQVLGIRNNHPGTEIKDTKIPISVINSNDLWEIIHRRDVLNSIGRGFFKTFKQYFIDKKGLESDLSKTKEFILNYDPDFIISSHYHLLLGIPNEYLKKTIFVQHTSFDYLLEDKFGIKVLKKYKNKIYKMCWLCESTMKQAIKYGFTNSTFIYNPNRFETNKIANVVNNKKIIAITRIHPQKRVDLMVSIVNDVFKNGKFHDWVFEIWGFGEFNKQSLKILKESSQIKFKGSTDNPMKKLLNASLTLNTSSYEGFPLSVIEGFTCGLPVVSFEYGESAKEQITDGYNGFVVKQNDIEEFKLKLIKLLSDKGMLLRMSKNAKECSKQYEISKVVDKWEELFERLENDNAES